MLDRIGKASEKREREHRALPESLWGRKFADKEQFDLAKSRGLPPPDILPHPDHVVIDDQGVSFIGPTDRESRKAWECLKGLLRMVSYNHAKQRALCKVSDRLADREALRGLEAYRRNLMRQVPKGWNWREEIFCRDSWLALSDEFIWLLEKNSHDLKKAGPAFERYFRKWSSTWEWLLPAELD